MASAPENVGAALRRAAAVNGDAIALERAGVALTHAELDRWSAGVAAVLAARGLPRSSSVALLARGHDFAILYFGLARAGWRVVPIEPSFQGEQLRQMLERSHARLAICDSAAEKALSRLSLDVPRIGVEEVLLEARRAPAKDLPEPSGDAELCVIFSSGSTGVPKGVILTHAAALARAALVAEIYSPGLRHLVMTPLAYAYGMINGLLCPLVSGGTAVLVDAYNPWAFKSALRELAPDLVMGIPVFYRHVTSASQDLLAGAPEGCRFYSAGELLPPAVLRAFRERYGRPIRQSYGLSETSTIAADGHLAMPRDGCVGRLVSDVAIRIVPSEAAEPRDDAVGEIWVERSRRFMKGYVEGTETADGRFVGEYYRTGDIGAVDRDGFLRVHGRNDDFVTVAGVRIHPSEIETALLAIDGVQEAAFLCERDHDTGRVESRAYVVLAAGSPLGVDAIRRQLRAELPPSRWPQRVEILAALPRTPTGKIARGTLALRLDERPAAHIAMDVNVVSSKEEDGR